MIEKDDFKDKIDFLFDIIKRYDHYIATTNFKVGLMMSFVSAIILGLTIRVFSNDIGGKELSCFYFFSVLFSIITIILSFFAAINLLRVIFPNTKNHNGTRSLIFFGDVSTYENGIEGYTRDLKKASSENLLEDLSRQTFIVAEIVNEKFRVLKIATRIMIYGVIPFLLISLFTLIIESFFK